MSTIDNQLIWDFQDEDKDVWQTAAAKIGGLGNAAAPFLKSHLSDRSSLSLHRHAWCALAAYLRAIGPDEVIRKFLCKGSGECIYLLLRDRDGYVRP